MWIGYVLGSRRQSTIFGIFKDKHLFQVTSKVAPSSSSSDLSTYEFKPSKRNLWNNPENRGFKSENEIKLKPSYRNLQDLNWSRVLRPYPLMDIDLLKTHGLHLSYHVRGVPK